ncbi:AFG1/ZapE family ATPase, partial [Candidatus Pelagibacter sp.]|nr:AFG1/ZapE family ATPase [Candidatus Pelagibacter sp.]
MQKSFVKEFKLYCKKKNLDVNSHQIKLIKILEEYYKLNYKSFISKFLSKKNYKKGFYLYGDVGVGKTMILDFFFNLVEGKKLKLHFNEFMLSYHDFVHQSKDKNDENKISKFVKKLKSKAKLIYFDEFQVTNIVDAMILGKLFDE